MFATLHKLTCVQIFNTQGGQTQGSNAPNIYPVDHVTSMLMDGKCINLVNLWRRHDISSGDDMILVLKKMVPTEYVLSRYPPCSLSPPSHSLGLSCYVWKSRDDCDDCDLSLSLLFEQTDWQLQQADLFEHA